MIRCDLPRCTDHGAAQFEEAEHRWCCTFFLGMPGSLILLERLRCRIWLGSQHLRPTRYLQRPGSIWLRFISPVLKLGPELRRK